MPMSARASAKKVVQSSLFSADPQPEAFSDILSNRRPDQPLQNPQVSAKLDADPPQQQPEPEPKAKPEKADNETEQKADNDSTSPNAADQPQQPAAPNSDDDDPISDDIRRELSTEELEIYNALPDEKKAHLAPCDLNGYRLALNNPDLKADNETKQQTEHDSPASPEPEAPKLDADTDDDSASPDTKTEPDAAKLDAETEPQPEPTKPEIADAAKLDADTDAILTSASAKAWLELKGDGEPPTPSSEQLDRLCWFGEVKQQAKGFWNDETDTYGPPRPLSQVPERMLKAVIARWQMHHHGDRLPTLQSDLKENLPPAIALDEGLKPFIAFSKQGEILQTIRSMPMDDRPGQRQGPPILAQRMFAMIPLRVPTTHRDGRSHVVHITRGELYDMTHDSGCYRADRDGPRQDDALNLISRTAIRGYLPKWPKKGQEKELQEGRPIRLLKATGYHRDAIVSLLVCLPEKVGPAIPRSILRKFGSSKLAYIGFIACCIYFGETSFKHKAKAKQRRRGNRSKKNHNQLVHATIRKVDRDPEGRIIDKKKQVIYDDDAPDQPTTNWSHKRAVKLRGRERNPDALKAYPVLTREQLIALCYGRAPTDAQDRANKWRETKKALRLWEREGGVILDEFTDNGCRLMPGNWTLDTHKELALNS